MRCDLANGDRLGGASASSFLRRALPYLFTRLMLRSATLACKAFLLKPRYRAAMVPSVSRARKCAALPTKGKVSVQLATTTFSCGPHKQRPRYRRLGIDHIHVAKWFSACASLRYSCAWTPRRKNQDHKGGTWLAYGIDVSAKTTLRYIGRKLNYRPKCKRTCQLVAQ